MESTPAGRLYSKTGWRFDASPGTGWWVGWVERPDGRITTFALCMDTDSAEEAAKRVPIGREQLAALNVLRAS